MADEGIVWENFAKQVNIFAIQFVALSGVEITHLSYLMECIAPLQCSVIKPGNNDRHAADELFLSAERLLDSAD